jgi:VanZ family protein
MKRSFVVVHLPFLLMAALIFALSSIPSLKVPGFGFTLQDKVFHFLEYLIFGVLLYRSALTLFNGAAPVLPLAFLAGLLFAASDEWHQSFVPGREGNVDDFIADGAGLIVALVLWRIISVHRNKKAKKRSQSEI